jgi:hypothetical protein
VCVPFRFHSGVGWIRGRQVDIAHAWASSRRTRPTSTLPSTCFASCALGSRFQHHFLGIPARRPGQTAPKPFLGNTGPWAPTPFLGNTGPSAPKPFPGNTGPSAPNPFLGNTGPSAPRGRGFWGWVGTGESTPPTERGRRVGWVRAVRVLFHTPWRSARGFQSADVARVRCAARAGGMQYIDHVEHIAACG